MVGLMVTFSKRAYATPRSLLHPEPLTLQQATADPYLCRRHSNTILSQSLWGYWVLVGGGGTGGEGDDRGLDGWMASATQRT